MVAIATIATHDPWEHPVGWVLLVPAMDISVVVASRPNVPPEEELRTAALADRLGYPELWVGEGFVWDAFALATAAGLATARILITVGPIPVSVRDPASIARGAASTAALIGRPVGVALGTSSISMTNSLKCFGHRARKWPVKVCETELC